MATFFDDFESYSLSSPPTGWTRRMTDVVWTTNVATVNSQKSVQWANGGNPGGMSTLTHDGVGNASGAVDLLFQFRIASTPNLDPIAIIYGDSAGTTSGICLSLDDGTHWSIRPLSGGGLGVAIGSQQTFTISNNTDYFCHFGTDGSNNWYAKMWAGAASSEPGGDGSPVSTSAQASGTNSAYSSGYAGQACISYQRMPSFSQFGFGTAGSIAPNGSSASPTPQQNPAAARPRTPAVHGGSWRERLSGLWVPEYA